MFLLPGLTLFHCCIIVVIYIPFKAYGILCVGEDPAFKDIEHQLDMWHKSNKLNAKLVEVTLLNFVVLNRIRIILTGTLF